MKPFIENSSSFFFLLCMHTVDCHAPNSLNKCLQSCKDKNLTCHCKCSNGVSVRMCRCLANICAHLLYKHLRLMQVKIPFIMQNRVSVILLSFLLDSNSCHTLLITKQSSLQQRQGASRATNEKESSRKEIVALFWPGVHCGKTAYSFVNYYKYKTATDFLDIFE